MRTFPQRLLTAAAIVFVATTGCTTSAAVPPPPGSSTSPPGPTESPGEEIPGDCLVETIDTAPEVDLTVSRCVENADGSVTLEGTLVTPPDRADNRQIYISGTYDYTRPDSDSTGFWSFPLAHSVPRGWCELTVTGAAQLNDGTKDVRVSSVVHRSCDPSSLASTNSVRTAPDLAV